MVLGVLGEALAMRHVTEEQMKRRLIGLCLVCFLIFTACAHHVTVPKTTPNPAIGHERVVA